jgi:hypothetical protein
MTNDEYRKANQAVLDANYDPVGNMPVLHPTGTQAALSRFQRIEQLKAMQCEGWSHELAFHTDLVGVEHPDVNKRCKLSADPDAVFDEVQAYVQGNGLDPTRVREVLRNTFAPAW